LESSGRSHQADSSSPRGRSLAYLSPFPEKRLTCGFRKSSLSQAPSMRHVHASNLHGDLSLGWIFNGEVCLCDPRTTLGSHGTLRILRQGLLSDVFLSSQSGDSSQRSSLSWRCQCQYQGHWLPVHRMEEGEREEKRRLRSEVANDLASSTLPFPIKTSVLPSVSDLHVCGAWIVFLCSLCRLSMEYFEEQMVRMT
jgi:hypothetical protein